MKPRAKWVLIDRKCQFCNCNAAIEGSDYKNWEKLTEEEQQRIMNDLLCLECRKKLNEV